MSAAIDRDRLLQDLGYGHPDARAQALEVLYAADLTNPRKSAIAANKRRRVQEALEAALVLLCARCAQDAERKGPEAGDGRRRVPAASPKDCERCGGSANRLAVDRAAGACRRRGVARLVVVGGAPGVHTALRSLWPDDLELRIVSGTERHSARQARTNLEWADVVIVWATTELDHKVSELYTKARADKVIVARRRGIEALADRLTRHVTGKR